MNKPDIYTPNIEALKALRADSTTAWITDEGILHVIPLFSHLEFFTQNTDVLPDVSAYLGKFAADDQSLRISKPHMAAAMDIIYGHGWGRVGAFGGDKLELDCAREHLTELRRKAKAVARVLNRTLVCRVVHPTQQKAKRAQPALSRDAFWSSFQPGFRGWLSPDGSLFETPTDAPFSTFTDAPDLLPEMAYRLSAAVDADQSRQRDEFCETMEGVEHMPWHQFWERPFNPDDDEGRELTLAILRHGWGRLSIIDAGRILIEVSPSHAVGLAQALDALATKVDHAVDVRVTDAAKTHPPEASSLSA